MDITPIIPNNKKIVNGYDKGYFLINNEKYTDSIIVFPEHIILFPELDINNTEHYLRFLNVDIEIILVGTGAEHVRSSSSVKNYLLKQNLNFEFMSTSAACRTYNILLSEGRYVIAVLVAL